MKKIVLSLLVILVLAWAAPAPAADVLFRGRSHNMAWNAAQLDDATPCTDCSYSLYIRNIRTGVEIRVGETTGLASVLIMPAEGRYRAGVQASRIIPPEVTGEEAVTETSSISWSDIPEVCAAGDTFWFRWFKAPLGPRGLQKTP